MSLPKSALDELRIERKEGARSQSRTWLWISLVVLGLGAASAVFLVKGEKALPVRTVLARETSSSVAKSERTVLNASGYVTARRQATVSSKVTGKVIEVLIEEGMKVQEGQVLARLDDTNVRTSLDLAQAQLKSAQAALAETRVRIKEADLNYRRIADLAKNKISAQAELDHAEAEEQSLRARL